VRSVFRHFAEIRIDVSIRTLEQYDIAVSQYDEHAGRDACDAESLRAFLRAIRETRSARTANNKRQALLTLWRFAHEERLVDVEPPRITKFREAKREPTAWTVQEVGQLLAACRRARTVGGSWTPQHWRALVLTAYDTSLRIGCLLAVPRDCLEGSVLYVPGELQKHRRDSRHRLHSTTVETIATLPVTHRLFHWPVRRRALWVEFGVILDDAGLPHGRRDKFHRLRRTSYSYVAAALGIDAATRHAGHAGDLSAVYLDRRLLDEPDPLDALPRPA